MRIELHPQGIQTSLGELAFQPRHPQLARQIAFVILVHLPGAGDQPVDEPAPQEHAAKRHEKRLRVVDRGPPLEAHERQHRGEDIDVGRGDGKAEQTVEQDPAGELLLGRWQPAIDGDDERRDEPPGPPLRERSEKRAAPVGPGRHAGQRKHESDRGPGEDRHEDPAGPRAEPRVRAPLYLRAS